MPSSLPSGQDLYRYMIQVGLVEENGGGIRVFDTRDEALEWMEEAILSTTGWIRSPEQEALDLSEIELLHKTDRAMIDALRPCVHERTVKAGEKVFCSEDEGDAMYLIRRGVVRILLPLKSGKQHHVATFNRGDYFGEMAFLDSKRRSADAVAKTECELYVVSRREFNDHIHRDPILGTRVFARIANAISLRLRETNRELSVIENR
jgi:SulP family sulfate permease